METTKKYHKLFLIQQKIKSIKKNSENPYFHTMYLDVNGLLAELKPILNEVGITVIQPIVYTPECGNYLRTIVIDAENGETLAESSIRIPEGKPQEMGSAITYFRRYCLQSLFLLEAEDDDAETTKQPMNPATALKPQNFQKTVKGNGKVSNVPTLCVKFPYNAQVKDAIKALPGSQYNSDGQYWTIDDNTKNRNALSGMHGAQLVVTTQTGEIVKLQSEEQTPSDLPWEEPTF